MTGSGSYAHTQDPQDILDSINSDPHFMINDQPARTRVIYYRHPCIFIQRTRNTKIPCILQKKLNYCFSSHGTEIYFCTYNCCRGIINISRETFQSKLWIEPWTSSTSKSPGFEFQLRLKILSWNINYCWFY